MRVAAIAFLGGVMVVQQLATLPSLGVWIVALICAIGLALWHPRWLILAFFLGGFVWAVFRADFILQQELPAALEGRDVTIQGVVADLPQPTDYGTRFVFDIEHAESEGMLVQLPSRVRLSTHSLNVRAGEQWRLTVRLRRPHGLQNPGGFDYEAYLFRERLRATGYVRDEASAERLGVASGFYAINRARQELGERMRSLMSERRQGGLIVALANGDSAGVTDNQWETLRATGTLHLVAISGLHITLIAGVVYWLVRFLWALPGITVLWLPAPLAGAIAGLFAATAYAALAGFVIPTQRALVMLAVAMGAVLLRRRFAPSLLLAVALLLVLLHDPFAVMAPGFWLSYGAVGVIIYVMYGDVRQLSLWRKWGYLQWAIAVGMLPLMLWLFQRVSLAAPIANLLAVPMFDLFVVPLTLIGAAATTVGADLVAGWLFAGGDWLLGLLWHPLEYLASIKQSQWIQHRPPAWTLFCGLIGVALLLAPRGWPGRLIGVVWLLPMVLVRPPAPQTGEVWFTVLDVGQGLAAVVRTESHVLVYDTGSRWSARSDAGRNVVVPYLRTKGLYNIDTLVVSHGDNDHAGGAASIIASMPIGRILSGSENLPGDACRAGAAWQWDGVQFTVLGPREAQRKPNNASCVLQVRSPHGAVLLPADIEKGAEHDLVVWKGAALAADILVAPHHGSRSSSSAEFLEAVRPRHVAFPVGYRNRYRHPHPLVVERYLASGTRLHDSPSSGALEFRLHASGIDVSAYRDAHRRYWFARASAP